MPNERLFLDRVFFSYLSLVREGQIPTEKKMKFLEHLQLSKRIPDP